MEPKAPDPHRGKERPKTVHELALERGKLRSPPPNLEGGGESGHRPRRLRRDRPKRGQQKANQGGPHGQAGL